MKINQLHLKHFRNYEELHLDFNDGLTIITGENAQGKTNLLEAIFLLSMGKSHRSYRDQELIQWGQKQAYIEGHVETQHYQFPLSLQIQSQGKIAKYNYIEQKKMSQFIGKLNVILFAPEDLQIIKGSPSQRRKFINAELGQSHPVYLQVVLDYERILKQRNLYLKEYNQTRQFDPIYFDIITDQLIDKAVQIIDYRKKFIDRLQAIAQPIHNLISKQNDLLTIKYLSSSSRVDYDQVDLLKEQFKDLFQQSIEREQKQGNTLYGPHRDDIAFFINDKDAQNFASQGQQRSIILALKLAEIEWFKEYIGEYPILLLDDVLSELDDNRQLILMQHIESKVQTFLTTATINGINLDGLKEKNILFVNNGQVRFTGKGE